MALSALLAEYVGGMGDEILAGIRSSCPGIGKVRSKTCGVDDRPAQNRLCEKKNQKGLSQGPEAHLRKKNWKRVRAGEKDDLEGQPWEKHAIEQGLTDRKNKKRICICAEGPDQKSRKNRREGAWRRHRRLDWTGI